MTICGFCGAETDNPKYCSSSCAAKKINTTHPKRRKTKICKEPGCLKTIYSRLTYCTEHARYKGYKKIESVDDLPDITISEVRGRAMYQKSSAIRQWARLVYERTHESRVCNRCGYDKHIDVCHIKAIKDFDPLTSIRVVNSPDNLIGLCPNCHWEFDNGELVL
jgi:hypothetical protein